MGSPEQAQARLVEIDDEIAALIKTKKGIATLIDCYPDGSDAKKQVAQQIQDCDDGVDKLNEEKVEIEAVLGVTGGGDYGAADPYAAGDVPEEDIYAYALYDY